MDTRPRSNPKSYVGRDLEVMASADNYHAWILNVCRPFVGGRAAEVGAGTGTFTKVLASGGFEEVVAYEPAENLFRILEGRVAAFGGVTAVNDLFPCARPDLAGRFDTVFYVNVLEHIPDDRGEVRGVRETLAPGGRLVIFVPALSWLYGEHDREVNHCRRYHRPELVRLLEEEGYRVLKASYMDFPGILPWFLIYRVLKRRMQGGHVSLYDRVAIPIIRRIESLITPPIGKNLLVIAERPPA